VRLLVCGHDETARTGVKRLAVDPGHHTAGRLTEGDARREVDAVVQVSIGYGGGAPAGSDPSHRQGGGDDAWAELLDEPFVGK